MGFLSFFKLQKHWADGKKKNCSSCGEKVVYDSEVAKYAMQHSSLFDWFFPSRIATMIIVSQAMLLEPEKWDDIPKKKNWKFGKDY